MEPSHGIAIAATISMRPGWRRARRLALFAGVPWMCTACEGERRAAPLFPVLVTLGSTATPFTGAIANAEPDDGQWVRAAKDYSSSRFSTLDLINTTNVSRLMELWRFSTGVVRGHEAAPIVADGMMFVVTPFPNIVYAFDLRSPGGAPAWTFHPKPRPAAQGVACCDVVNRGATYADGKVVFNTLDGQTYALDGRSGRVIWQRQLGDIHQGETITMAPLIVKDRVLVGNSGGEFGVRAAGWSR
jgi:lanthanide-dependent methanol dehydrogenase